LSACSEFERAVYAAARAIPRGETRTYGELAAALGQPGAAQAVGLALGRNPVPIVIPCHRILAASGGTGGFSAPGGVATKFRMLAIEGAVRGSESGLFENLPLAVKPAPLF
jgi:methylated-DNA-[protein]-cysteine S-methyltransferase